MRRALSAGILLLAAACGDGGLERGLDLQVSADPSLLQFVALAPGARESRTVTLTHVGGSGVVTLGAARMEPASGEWVVDGPAAASLAPGESTTLVVEYRPSDYAQDGGAVIVPIGIPGAPDLRIPVTTTEPTPALAASPPTLAFGAVASGSVLDRVALIRNTGTAPVTVTAVGLDLSGGAPFSLADAPEPPIALLPGEELAVTVRFAPPELGPETTYPGWLRLRTDHPATDNSAVPLSGTARHAMLQVTPPVVDFGWVAAGGVATRELLIRNTGADPVTLEAPALAEPAAGLSLLGAPAGTSSLVGGESLTITLRYAPQDGGVGPDLGRVVLRTDDFVVQDREIPVTGRSAVPALTIIPSPVVDFGIVGIGYQHQRTVWVVNQGLAPLTLQDVRVLEGSAEGFGVLGTPDLPVTLAFGGTAELHMGYLNPGLEDGDAWGELRIGSDDPVIPEVVTTLRAINETSGACHPRFEPPVTDFGTLATGTSLERTVRLHNDGSLPCVVQSIAFLGCLAPDGICLPELAPSTVFRAAPGGPVAGRTIGPLDAVDVPVTFQPPDPVGAYAAITVATLADGVHGGPFFQYHSPLGGSSPSLRGRVSAGGLAVIPDEVNFGAVPIGCGSKGDVLQVTRVGEAPVSLASVEVLGCKGELHLESAAELPAPAFPETPLLIGVQWGPKVAGPLDCRVRMGPDVPGAAAPVVRLLGEAVAPGQRTELFQQDPVHQVDVLFVVDNSGSMNDQQQSLVAGFEGFVAAAATWNVAYQIGVITTDAFSDQGVLVGDPPWVTNADPTPFEQNALVGTDGTGDERGLQTAWLALQPKNVANTGQTCSSDFQCQVQSGLECIDGSCRGPNGGFLRPAATLAIIWLSDEEDHSSAQVADYVAFFQSLKGNSSAVRGYAIVGDPPSEATPEGGCGLASGPGGGSGPSKTADPGLRYIEAAQALGGAWFSICEFGASDTGSPPLLEQIGLDAFEPRNTFVLANAPTPGSIAVEVAGAPCTTGWSFDAEANAVVFSAESPCFPGPTEAIRVQYELACFEVAFPSAPESR